MAHVVAYKNIASEDEASYGASTGGLSSRLRVTSFNLNKDVNKELVEDTMVTAKGRDRIVEMKTVVEGDIAGYGTPRGLDFALELANGVAGSSAALGLSAGTITTYYQNTTGTLLSKTINVDRNNSQDKYQGVFGKELTLKASDGLLEWSLTAQAKDRVTGEAIADSVSLIGETIKPFTFADINIQITAGQAYSAAAGVTHAVSEWELKYNNGAEGTHLSGNKTLARVDPKVPTIEGKFKIFHEGTSWVSAAEGSSVFHLRFEGVLPSSRGLIHGVTPYILRIDVHKAQLKTNVRDYEQAAFSVEDVEFIGAVSSGSSALWTPTITADNLVIT